ncbi:MAG: asparagine synthase (glutamine-hydrolyzing) [Desulfobacula sp.]|uniref:asparagine synthase (glutamine-hydrolyzing) n=1 Tax=Desulfobacula sp. TaxID=2593537 RepID=UPI0025C49462|nr:asparagine synthase (glutamine-hydrolyzing) [Desulfobacula sp.]MCD4721405.1 asparagine synthase (glutamine-hydrolyzing) [Desulfobacula sp.]
MCGVAGFIGQGSRTDIKRMTDALQHRGPDADGFFHDQGNGLFFGHRRLSIIDIQDGMQPMSTTDNNLAIIFNGEIYNHAELRNELEQKGHKFISNHSDTEVLLHGYREWGEKLPGKLNGMWVFALYDRQKKLVFISRDRFGKKPLFYSIQNNTFVFSSELSSLVLHPSIKTSISEKSLKKYFAYGYIPSPGSIYKNISKLPGGHNLIYSISSNRLEIKKYWEFVLEPFEKIPSNPEEEWGEELRSLISKAVKRRLVSDVPLGIFLSGGIDSSCVAAFAASFMEPGALKTFSISFDEKSFDESKYASMAAAFINTDHYNEKLSLEKSKSLLSKIISKLDEPMGDSSLLPTYLLSRTTRKHVTVALGGDGADELFAGYDPFRALQLANLYSKLVPRPIHKGIQSIIGMLPVSHKNMSLDFKLKRTLRGLSFPPKLWSPVWLGPLSPVEIKELFNEPVDIEDLYSEAIELWDTCKTRNLTDQTLQFYTRFYLQDDILVKVDRASMMNSLEVRAPFLDIELVDFVRRIPSQYKYRNGQTKYILKKALEKILPKEILYRSKKGFGIPVGKWLKQPFFDFNKTILPDMLNSIFLEKIQKDHLENKADNRAFLWNYWLFKTWNQKR